MQFKIKIMCTKLYVYHLRNVSSKCLCFISLFLFFSVLFSRVLQSPVYAIELRNHAGYYSLCIIRHDKIHGFWCTLEIARVIQSPGSDSFKLIVENIPRSYIGNNRATYRILFAGSLKHVAS